MAFIDQRAARFDIGLAAAGRDPAIGLHARHQQLEIPRRQPQVQVELAKVVKVLGAHRLVAGVERFDDARADGAAAAIRARHHLDPGMPLRIVP